MTLPELIAELERAEVGSRELDEAVDRYLGICGHRGYESYSAGDWEQYYCPACKEEEISVAP